MDNMDNRRLQCAIVYSPTLPCLKLSICFSRAHLHLSSGWVVWTMAPTTATSTECCRVGIITIHQHPPSPSNRHTHLFQTPNLNLYYDNQTPCRYIIESRLYRLEKSNCLSFQEIKGSTLSTGVYGPKNLKVSLCKRLVKYEVIFPEPQSCHVMPMQSRSCAIMCEVWKLSRSLVCLLSFPFLH